VRIPVRDRTWSRFRTELAVAPVPVPSLDQVRDVLLRVRDAAPDHPLLSRVRGHRREPVPVPALLSRCVLTVPSDDPAELVRAARAAPYDGLPFRLVLGDGAVALQAPHVLGDGTTKNTWLVAFLTGSVEGVLEPDTSRLPLVRALARTYARDPRRLLAGLRGALPLAPSAPAGTRPVEVGEPVWLSRVLPAAEVARRRAWRDEHAPGTSLAALTMASTVQALRDHGLAGPGATVMMDCRRYLGDDARVTGNFATGPWLDVDAGDAAALSRALSGAAASGVPLLLLGALTLRARLRPPTAGASVASTPLRTRLNLSYLGRVGLDSIPWTDPAAARYLIAADPAGPDGLTVAFVPTPAGLQVSVSLHPEVVDLVPVDA
jgi:hypothetical protein